jgi:Tol biopolymer transport system component
MARHSHAIQQAFVLPSYWCESWRIYAVSAEGGGLEQLMAGEVSECDPGWSPDGRFIAATTMAGGVKSPSRLMLFDVATQQWRTLLRDLDANYAVWSRNGKYIYFSDPNGTSVPFYRVSIADHTLERVADVNLLPRGPAPTRLGI